MEKCIARVDPFASDDEGRFSWMFMGSLARREPFPGSDVDTGLVWRAPEYDGRREDVAASAAKVLDAAEACGLERCSSGANADNPLFNRSIESWRTAAKHWEDYGAGFRLLGAHRDGHRLAPRHRSIAGAAVPA